MSSTGTTRSRRKRTALILLLLLFAVGGTVAYRLRPTPTLTLPVAAVLPVVPTPAPAPVGPSFDIVRVGPTGRAVIAGRAASGADVTVRDGDRVLGQVRADGQGQFVLIPDAALAPGGRELTLSARLADGTERAGADSVFLLVPTPGPAKPADVATAAPVPPVAVLLPRDAAPPRVLDAGRRKLGLDTVDYDGGGEIRFAGSAVPGAPIRLYVDNRPVGDATADAAGQWRLQPTAPVAPGIHQLRIDQLGANGRVLNRVELPFQRSVPVAMADLAPEGLAPDRAIVQPGQNLWRIARQSYGQGTRFTIIYLANRDQIRDPNRIYPGQVFAVPPRP